MAEYDDINLAKGSLSITLFTNDVTEGGDNQLTEVPIPTTKRNQSSGQKDTKVVDLLRITNTFHIIAYITSTSTKTAKTIKAELRNLFKGAGVDTGDPITLTYEGETYSVYPRKWTINKLHAPINLVTSTTVNDVAIYNCVLDLVEGVAA